MRVEVEDYKTGWITVGLYLKEKDIENLIRSLNELLKAEAGQHFHISNSDLSSQDGVFDIEIVRDEESAADTFQGPSGFAMGRSTES